MAEASATNSPDIGQNDSASPSQTKTPAAYKDRTCKYCGQAFTSSSLGRHLDQYISKKKPDGIHDVEEIKRLRGTITRRQARGSTVKQDDDGPESVEALSARQTRSDSPLQIPFTDQVPKQGMRVALNMVNWQATGVINGLPGSGTPPAQVPAQGSSTNLKRAASVVEPGGRYDGTEKDTIKALELALREVLDNVQAASARPTSQPSPFDFDFQAQSYASLCLLVLPPPPTLFSSHPFSTPQTIPIEPPGMQQLDPVRAKVQTLIDRWRVDQLSEPSVARTANTQTTLDIGRQHLEMARQHLELAYQNWIRLSNEAKQEQWRLELMRAYIRESEKQKQTEDRLHRVEQEARRLQAQVDMLSRCQWPREFALFPPESRPFSQDTSKALRNSQSANNPDPELQWDYDNIVQRWRRVVTEDAARRLGMGVSSRPTADALATITPTTQENIENRSLPLPLPQSSSSRSTEHTPSKKARLLNGSPRDGEEGHGDPASATDNGSHGSDRPMNGYLSQHLYGRPTSGSGSALDGRARGGM